MLIMFCVCFDMYCCCAELYQKRLRQVSGCEFSPHSAMLILPSLSTACMPHVVSPVYVVRVCSPLSPPFLVSPRLTSPHGPASVLLLWDAPTARSALLS